MGSCIVTVYQQKEVVIYLVMENKMEKIYLKPEIINETKLERVLVYANAQTQEDGCTTLQGKIDQDAKLS